MFLSPLIYWLHYQLKSHNRFHGFSFEEHKMNYWMWGYLSSNKDTIHTQLICCCTMNYFRYRFYPSSSLLSACGLPGQVTNLGFATCSIPRSNLCHSSLLLSGISTPQLISLFVMSSLLTFSVCLVQLLWFKMKWLIKQTNFSCTLYTRRQLWGGLCCLPCPSFFSPHMFPFLSWNKRKEKWLFI